MDKKKGNEIKDLKSKSSTKSKERWLLTRKTWRYMSDAGRKLFPEGVSPHSQGDIAKIEEHFQDISKQCSEYVIWNPSLKDSKTSSPAHDSSNKFNFFDIDDYDMRDESDQSCGFSAERASSSGDILSTLPSEIYSHLLKYYGASTLHHVASRILEEQLIEEDEPKYDEDDGEIIEVDGRFLRSVGIQTDPFLDMCVQTDETATVEDHVRVGAETRAETEATVAYERAVLHHKELLKRDGPQNQNELRQKYTEEEYGNIVQQQFNIIYQQELSRVQAHSIGGHVEKAQPLTFTLYDDDYSVDEKDNCPFQAYIQTRKYSSSNLQQNNQRSQDAHCVPLQPSHPQGPTASNIPAQKVKEDKQLHTQQQVHQPPVLKRFWARRESLTKVELQQNQSNLSEKQRTSSIEKDKGMVAAKLASLEAAATSTPPNIIPQQKVQLGSTTVSGPMTVTTPKPTQQQVFTFNQKPQQSKQTEKKNQNVFKLGLKCDIDTPTGNLKKEVGKKKVDLFKTLNYDKTLRNIKSKWVPSKEEEAFIQSIMNKNNKEREREMKCKERKMKETTKSHQIEKEHKESDLEKKEKTKKKKARAIQVGEPLPQFILNSFRINSPVQIIHATKKRFRKLSSKSDSVSESEYSTTASGMTSPRYSITILEEQKGRDLKVSESEAYKLLQMGIPFNCNVSPTDSYAENAEESPSQQSQTHRSLSAVQVSGHIAQILHSIRGSRLHQTHFTGQPDKSRSLTQSILQSLLPAVMQRGRSSGSGHTSRLGGKRMWRARSKSQSRASAGTTSVWSPMGKSKWMSVTGRIITLESTLLMNLSELERVSLQRISLTKLQTLNLGCQIKLPKEFNESLIKKKRPYLLKRKGLTSNKRDDIRSPTSGWVFGLPLNKCIENDKQRIVTERDSLYFGSQIANSVDDDGYLSRKSSQVGSSASFASLLEGTKQSNTGSLENLSFDRKRPSLGNTDVLMSGNQYASPDMLTIDNQPQIPSIVTGCCKHIETYGLHTLGIFRVSPSKKKVNKLREDFDSGKDVILSEENCPHEVAAILKEFFRDLPDPLLARELYEPFLNTQKIRNRKQQLEALQFLVQLLPLPNRDTLYTLLNFLTTVAENAADSIDKSGCTIPGNKMDSTNIATIFAPNILHQAKTGCDQLSTIEMKTNAIERGDIINVIRCMIDHNKELFEVTSDLLNETYLNIVDNYPEALDSLLRGRYAEPDDREQVKLQRLIATLLEPNKALTSPKSRSASPVLTKTPRKEDEYELESSSSVFDGSEVSSPVPRSPTDKNDFERLQSTTFGDELEGKQKRLHEVITTTNYPDKLNLRYKKPPEMLVYQDVYDGKQKISECIIRRGSKGAAMQLVSGSKISSKHENGDSKKSETMNSKESLDSQNGIQVLLGRDSKMPMSGPTVRRLSSPDIDNCNVMTASLKIPGPRQQATSLALTGETDIPYIEDSSTTCSRQRTGSNDSFLGQPITGTMSFQPLAQKDMYKNSHDSMISSSSMGFYTMSPSERNTPNSENPYMSGNSTPISGIISPPLMWLSPDSGTPGLSPPSSPLPEKMTRKKESIPSQQYAYLSSHSANIKPIPPQRSKSKGIIQRISPLSKSRTSDAIRDSGSIQQKDGLSRVSEVHKRSEDVAISYQRTIDADTTKKSTKKRYIGNKRHSGQITHLPPDPRQSRDGGQHVWKRWEIIASDPTEPETYV